MTRCNLNITTGNKISHVVDDEGMRGPDRDCNGISELTLIQLISPYKISCIIVSLEIPLQSLDERSRDNPSDRLNIILTTFCYSFQLTKWRTGLKGEIQQDNSATAGNTSAAINEIDLAYSEKMVNILSSLYRKLLLFFEFASLSICLFETSLSHKGISEIVIKGIADNYFDYFRSWLPSNHCLDRLRSLKRQTDWWVLNVPLLEICTFVQFSVTRACLSPGIDCNLDILLDFIVWLHPFLQPGIVIGSMNYPKIQLISPYKISCIIVRLEIPLLFLPYSEKLISVQRDIEHFEILSKLSIQSIQLYLIS